MPKQPSKIKLSSLNGPASKSATKKDEPQAKAKSQRAPFLPGGPLLWCLVGLAVGLTVWIGGRTYLKHVLAQQLASASSEEAAIQSIDALLRLDGNATIEVSRGLGHPEFMVANAAFRALGGQLDAWTKLEPAERLQRMQTVVDELEKIPTDIDQDHRILVSGLASRIYADTLSSREIGAGNVLEGCRRVLARTDPQHVPVSHLAQLRPATPSTPQPLEPAEVSPVPPPLAPMQEPITTRSVSEGPIETRSVSEGPTTPAALDPSDQTHSNSNASSRNRSMTRMSLSDDEAGDESAPAGSRMHLTAGSAALPQRSAVRASVVAMPIATQESPDPLSDSGSSRSRVIPQQVEPLPGGVFTEPVTLSGIEQLPIDQLVRLLSSVQPRVAQAAASMLRQRGMSDEHLEMAMQMAIGSASTRQALLDQIMQSENMDVRPWLLWMATDGQEPVRQHAVALLKPIARDDEDVRRQLRLLLNKERDEKVSQTIRQALAK